MEGEAEYAFWHVLARDVAYGSLPRASRAARHVAAAQWIEAKAGDRLEDRADVLAHHYGTALELALAAGLTAEAADLEGNAFRFLSLAGERALSLDTAAALAHLERALALVPQGRPERATALARFGEAAFQAGRYGDARTALDEAIGSFRLAGEIPAAARAMGPLASVLARLGDPRQWTVQQEALALLEPLGASPGLVAALTEMARAEALQYRSEDALRLATRAIDLAEKLDLPRPARALGYRGMARTDLGDAGGLTDLREAIELATHAGEAREVANLYNNLGSRVWFFEGPAAYREVQRDELAYVKPRGLTAALDILDSGSLDELVDTGEHEEALALAAAMIPRLEASADVWGLMGVRDVQARILALRGDGAQVAEMLEWLESSARETEDPLFVVLGLASAALVRAGLGQRETAAALLREIDAHHGARANPHYPSRLNDMVRTALGIGEADLAERLVAGYKPRTPFGEHALVAANAMLAEARGDFAAAVRAYADAAERWAQFGIVPEHAYALLGEGRCLVGLGRRVEAREPLVAAREIFESLGARPALAETDAFLERARSGQT
jgi:tetratricopeptide (TPR) repeat protein